MINKIKKLLNLLFKPKLLKKFLSMNSSGYLFDIGWNASFEKQMPIDKNYNYLPWVTYSFIDFISDRLNKNMNIFEYGSGNSTLWYGDRVNSVTSVEHDKVWFDKIYINMPKNVDLHYQELVYGGKYSHFLSQLEKKFHIIIVDGRDRVNCMKYTLNGLTEDGVIILDDSEREEYEEGINFLIDNHFKRIDFWGIAPGISFKKCTTIFYKQNDCLNIT